MTVKLSDEQINKIVDRLYERLESEGLKPTAPLVVGVEELAKYLLVKKAWVYGRMKSLPHFKAGKHSRFVLEEVLISLRRDTGDVNGQETSNDTDH